MLLASVGFWRLARAALTPNLVLFLSLSLHLAVYVYLCLTSEAHLSKEKDGSSKRKSKKKRKKNVLKKLQLLFVWRQVRRTLDLAANLAHFFSSQCLRLNKCFALTHFFFVFFLMNLRCLITQLVNWATLCFLAVFLSIALHFSPSLCFFGSCSYNLHIAQIFSC